MDAGEKFLLSFLSQDIQMIIPIYQRKYSWTFKECKQLLNDIIHIGKSENAENHFIGSIVYMKQNSHVHEDISKLMIIDGQQRITTLTLLISAITEFLNNNPNINIIATKKLINKHLIHDMEEGELKYRLILSQEDKNTLTKIIDNITSDSEKSFNENDSTRIKDNFEFFKKNITPDNINDIYNGLKKLSIIYVALEQGKDNPQLIFESLNSTGLELNQADLIRNYILMGLETDKQNKLYNDYWHEIELIFEEQGGEVFDKFIKYYLILKLNKIPAKKNIYEEFKKYSKEFENITDLVKDIYKFAIFYSKIALSKEEDSKLKSTFDSLSGRGNDVIYPLMLNLYKDYTSNEITKEDLIEMFKITESYLLRRLICEIPTNSLNKTFAFLYKEIKEIQIKLNINILNAYKLALIYKESYKRIPKNEEFARDFKTKDIYNLSGKHRDYILSKLENYNSKEITNINNYTIEHIMPQNPKLSTCWQNDLGSNWKEIQKDWLHTIGNLTLTGYNSELSDKCFIEKRDMGGGFRDSAIRLNISLKELDTWNKEEIIKRADDLIEKAIKIWQYPSVDEELKIKFLETIYNKDINDEYEITDHIYLQENSPMRPLFDELSKQILAIDEKIKMEPKKLYIAFKTKTNFVDIVPQKTALKLSLNIPYDKVNDLKGQCKNIKDLGRWGNGETSLKIKSYADLDYGIFIIKQAYEYVNK